MGPILKTRHRQARKHTEKGHDYRSREPGSMTKILAKLELPTLERRKKEDRLCMLFKISKGLVPVIPIYDYLKPITEKKGKLRLNYLGTVDQKAL